VFVLILKFLFREIAIGKVSFPPLICYRADFGLLLNVIVGKQARE
jgi:hypothetical protein